MNFKKIKRKFKYIINPYGIFSSVIILMDKTLKGIIPDTQLIKCRYYTNTGRKLNLNNPQSFNEKIQWLKLYGNLEQYTHLADKYEVRNHISETIGEKYLIPLIGVWDRFEDINFENLPVQFVLKCTHDSASIVICKDKNNFNFDEAKKKINKCLKYNYYYPTRQMQYKNIKPRIICEKYMEDEEGTDIKDYKIFCFNGHPKLIRVDYDQHVNHKRNIYDIDWNYIPVTFRYPNDHSLIENKPDNLEEMLGLARVLSDNYPHVRVDFYIIKGKIFFGEFTFSNADGCQIFDPEDFDILMGSWLELPEIQGNK